MTDRNAGANAGQREYWNAAQRWIDDQAAHDEMLEDLGRLAMRALRPLAGERILDIGCGTGTTTLELSDAVGDDGAVVGADISVPMLERARERARGRLGVTFIEADAQTYGFEPGSFDGAFSRFGVMFFDDPAEAFANIARALRPGGRFAFVAWQAFERQEWQMVAAKAGGIDSEWARAAPGPFSFGDRGLLARYLDEAGFVRTDIEDVEGTILVGGAGDLDSALRFVTEGRLGRQILEEHGDEGIARVRQAFSPYVTSRGVAMGCAVWLVTAIRGEHG